MKEFVLLLIFGIIIVCETACPDSYKSAWVRSVGDWPVAKGYAAWQVDNPIGLMVFQESTCTYKSDPISGLNAGTLYQWKVTVFNSWDNSIGCPGSVYGNSNCGFVAPASGTVTFNLNFLTKQMWIENTGGGGTVTPPPTLPPSSADGKQVYAHFMMGNTYGYTQQLFENDMNKAKIAGIDAFALNIGLDSWSNDRLGKAYAAAAATGFKCFLSFDMVYWGSSSSAIIDQIKLFGNHAGQYRYKNKIYVSTFGGLGKTMGYSSENAAWSAIKTSLSNSNFPIFFVPNFPANPSTFFNTFSSSDGAFSWGAWPSPNSAVEDDSLFMTAANNAGKVYMAPWSPLFYAHFPDKNYLYDFDGLWFSRWQQILSVNPHMIEIITWNDWGESHYIAPVDPNPGNIPNGALDYVNGFDHSFLLETLPYFIRYYKTGVAPTITKDIVVYWYRPHPAKATASSDPIGRPKLLNQRMQDNNYDLSYLSDHIYVLTILKQSGTIKVNGVERNVPAGASMYSTQMPTSGNPTVSLSRANTQVCSHTGAVTITSSPTKYNFNIYVGGCLSN